MRTSQNTARWTGLLFIVGTVAGALSVVFVGPPLGDPDYLSQIAANENEIIIGALLFLTMGLALALIPVLMFPILKKHNETLALGYVVFRSALENIAHIALVIVWLMLLTLSRHDVATGAVDSAAYLPLGETLLGAGDWIVSLLAFPFCLGALIFYYQLYQTRLVPRWLSIWGLAGAALYLAAPLSSMFGTELGFAMAPLALQEMVLALWLIVKGFDASAPVLN